MKHSSEQGCTTTEQCAKIFLRKMLHGDVRGVVKFLTEMEKGGVLMPDDLDEKIGLSVEDVLRFKHPCARSVDATHLHLYDFTPVFVDLDITPAIVKHVA